MSGGVDAYICNDCGKGFWDTEEHNCKKEPKMNEDKIEKAHNPKKLEPFFEYCWSRLTQSIRGRMSKRRIAEFAFKAGLERAGKIVEQDKIIPRSDETLDEDELDYNRVCDLNINAIGRESENE